MKTINLTEKEFNSLTKYKKADEVIHSESEIYVLDLKTVAEKHGKEKLLLKKYKKELSKEIVNSRLLTINMLSLYEQDINIKELNIAKYKVQVDGIDVGVAIKEIEDSRNLGDILHSSDTQANDSINYLYMVGELVNRVHNQRVLPFNFGDLQEYNFIVDENDNLYAIDLEGIYIPSLGLNPSTALYLVHNNCINRQMMSHKEKFVYPSNNTDLLCYNLMILNSIFKYEISQCNLEYFNEYLRYLKCLGFGKDILDSFNRLYSDRDNINPYCYLDQIPLGDMFYASIDEFEKCKRKISVR